MATGNILCQLFPGPSEPPASNYALQGTRNLKKVLEFDTGQKMRFRNILPPHYGGGGITLVAVTAGKTATSGDFVLGGAIEANADGGTDIDSDSFASQKTATSTTNATSGILTQTTITFSNGAEIDSLAAGKMFTLELERLASGNSMTGLLQLVGLWLKET